MPKRLIPCLLIKDQSLVKTVKFVKPNYLGDPINAVKIFSDKGADELLFLDITASIERREPNIKFIHEIVSEAFMPISYGGGITSLDQIAKILRVGVEKISINSSAFLKPKLITEAVKEFGSSTIIGAMDIKTSFFRRKQFAYIMGGAINTKMAPSEYSKYLENLGVGELFLNFVDREGTYEGYNIELINLITNNLKIPVIANGGAGSLFDVEHLFRKTNVNAASAGSIFIYQGLQKGILISYPDHETIKGIVGIKNS